MENGIRALADLRLLKTAQFAKTTGLTVKHAGHILRDLRHYGYVDHTGGGVILGGGRTPQIWFLTKLGWHYFTEITGLELSPFVQAQPIRAWPQTMPHRLATVDIFLSLQCAMKNSGVADIKYWAFDFRTVDTETGRRKETTDFLGKTQTKKIIPDAAFHVVRQDGHEALMFLETDMGTEGTNTRSTTNTSLIAKFKAYDHYLKTRGFRAKYRPWGRFEAFLLLFVTTTKARIDRIIGRTTDKLGQIKSLILFTTHEALVTDPLGKIWWDMNGDTQSLFGLEAHAL